MNVRRLRILIACLLIISPEKLTKLRIADISCGSGTFLQEAFQFIVDCATRWYEQNAPAHLEEGAHGEKRLPFTDRDLPLVVGAT